MSQGKLIHCYIGLLNEIAGPKSSGRTTLAYREIVRFLELHAEDAVIIDTIGTFNPRMLNDLQTGMEDRIHIIRTMTIYGVIDAVRESTRAGIILIDNITNPLSLVMQYGKNYNLMEAFMIELTLMRKTVILINNTVKTADYPASAFAGINLKPALGPQFTHLVDHTILVHPIAGRRVIEVIRSRRECPGDWIIA